MSLIYPLPGINVYAITIGGLNRAKGRGIALKEIML